MQTSLFRTLFVVLSLSHSALKRANQSGLICVIVCLFGAKVFSRRLCRRRRRRVISLVRAGRLKRPALESHHFNRLSLRKAQSESEGEREEEETRSTMRSLERTLE